MLSGVIAIAYLLLVSATTTATYTKQNEIMPIWAYGVIFASLAVGLLATLRYRASWLGRGVAVFVVAFLSFYASTFHPQSPTGIMFYSVMIYMAWGEAAFTHSED